MKIKNPKPTAIKWIVAGGLAFFVVWLLVIAALAKAAWLCLFGSLCG
jgi:hypothetical protein